LSPHHSRLHEFTLEALMCAQSWLKHKQQSNENIIIIFIQLGLFYPLLVVLIIIFYSLKNFPSCHVLVSIGISGQK